MAAQESKDGKIFWYYLKNIAFGFSSDLHIEINVCDDSNPEDTKRLCISLNQQQVFEGRIGNLNQLE